MKKTHRDDLRCWSRFDEARDMDFHSYAWLRPKGAVLFDPLPLSDHDAAQLGEVAWIVLTNSDHRRGATAIAERFGALIAGPRAEKGELTLDRGLGAGDELVEGLRTIELAGSKTPGELAFVLEDTTLITGDLVRAPRGGALAMLPEAKLADPEAARASVRGLLEHDAVDAILVGDGWPIFTGARRALERLVAALGD